MKSPLPSDGSYQVIIPALFQIPASIALITNAPNWSAVIYPVFAASFGVTGLPMIIFSIGIPLAASSAI